MTRFHHEGGDVYEGVRLIPLEDACSLAIVWGVQATEAMRLNQPRLKLLYSEASADITAAANAAIVWRAAAGIPTPLGQQRETVS